MKKKKMFTGNMRELAMLVALVVIIIFFYICTQGKILKPMNISNLINQNAYVVILAIGMLLCILTGGNIDLSVGSTVALIGACAAIFIIEWHWNVYLSIGLCLLLREPLGVTTVEMPSFVAVFASPVAVSSAVMVQEIGGDDQLASQLVVWTSAVSMATIFAIVFALRTIGAL